MNGEQEFFTNFVVIVWNNLRVEGVTEFALSPGKNCSVAVFIAERKVGHSSFYPCSCVDILVVCNWIVAARS